MVCCTGHKCTYMNVLHRQRYTSHVRNMGAQVCPSPRSLPAFGLRAAAASGLCLGTMAGESCEGRVLEERVGLALLCDRYAAYAADLRACPPARLPSDASPSESSSASGSSPSTPTSARPSNRGCSLIHDSGLEQDIKLRTAERDLMGAVSDYFL